MEKIKQLINNFIKKKISIDIPENKFDKISQFYNNENLKILCWNIKILPYKLKTLDYINILYNKIKEHDPDVICIQECFASLLKNKTKFLSKFHKYNYSIMPIESINLSDSGLIILSKYTIEESIFDTFNDCSKLNCLAGKGVLIIRIGDLWIFNTHLDANAIDKLINIQIKQLDQINKIYNNLKNYNPNYKFIILGDFNININNYNNNKFMKNYFDLKLLSKPNKNTWKYKTLDLIYSNLNLNIDIHDNYPSDHNLIIINV